MYTRLSGNHPNYNFADGWFVNEIEPLGMSLLDMSNRQIMRRAGCTGFGDNSNFRLFPQMHRERRRAAANWYVLVKRLL